jgi:hypothetical protein
VASDSLNAPLLDRNDEELVVEEEKEGEVGGRLARNGFRPSTAPWAPTLFFSLLNTAAGFAPGGGLDGVPYAGALLGGPALGDLAARVNATVAFPNATAHPVPRLVALSAHYNVLLGIMSTLRLDVLLSAADASNVPFLTLPNVSIGVIPSPAALIAFELHRSSDATRYAVRLVLQNGPAASYVAVPLPCASAAAAALGGAGACSLPDFQAFIAPALAAAGTPAAWCGACGPFVTDPNQTPLPLPCAAVQLQQLLSQQALDKSKKKKDGGGSIGGATIAAIVLGIALGVTLVAGMVAVALARGRRGAPACIRGSGADQSHEMADQGGQERLVVVPSLILPIPRPARPLEP